jgi:hypothetical protein
MTARVVFLALLGTDNWYLGGSVLDRAAQAGMSPWNEVVALLLGLGVVCGSLAATAWSEPGAGVAVGTSSKTTVAALPAATALTVAAAPASTTVPVPASAAPEPCLVPPNAGVIGHLDPAATVWIRVEMGLTGIATICVSSDGVLTYVGHSSTGDIAITPAVVDGQTIVAANGSTLYILDCANRVVRYEYPDGRSAAAPDGFSQASSCG